MQLMPDLLALAFNLQNTKPIQVDADSVESLKKLHAN